MGGARWPMARGARSSRAWPINRWPLGSSPPELPVTRSAVSQHLKILKDAGLVSETAAGTRRIYRLNPVAVAALRDQLDTFWQRALVGYTDIAAETTEETTEEKS